MAAYLGHRHGQLGDRPALPDDPQVSYPFFVVDGDHDLGDHGADQLLALGDGGRRCVKYRLDVGAGGGDPGEFLAGQRYRAAGLLGAQVVFGLPHRGQLVLPRAFQGAGDQPVLRLDRVVLAPGPAGFILGALDGEGERGQPLPVVLLGFGQRLGGGFQRRGFEHREQLGQDGLFAAAAALGAIELLGAGADIAGAVAFRPGVAGLHDPPAPAAAQQALQQRGALPWGAAAVSARRPPVRAQPGGVGLVFLPGDESGVMAGDQHRPLLAGQLPHSADHLPGGVYPFPDAGAAEHERPGIGGVGQQVMHCRVGGRRPADPPRAGPPAGQQQPVFAQRQQHLAGRAELIEAPVNRRDRLGHRLIRGEDHPAVLVVVQPHRQALPQLTTCGLVPQALGEPGADQVQLGLGHRSLKAQHEAVVIAARMVDAVGVGDQGVGQRAQIQQLIPVGVGAGQPRALQRQHDPGLAQPDIGDQLRKPRPARRRGTGPAQVLIDHHHLVRRPAQQDRPLPQIVLAGQALSVGTHLQQRGLAHIHIRVPGPVRRSDLLPRDQQHRALRQVSHRSPPPRRSAPGHHQPPHRGR